MSSEREESLSKSFARFPVSERLFGQTGRGMLQCQLNKHKDKVKNKNLICCQPRKRHSTNQPRPSKWRGP